MSWPPRRKSVIRHFRRPHWRRKVGHGGSEQAARISLLLIVFAVVALVLATQQSLARALAGWFAGPWIATMDLVLRMLGAVLSG